MLLKLVTLYVTDFQESIQGTSKSLHALPTDELVGGARLAQIFHHDYGETVGMMDAADDLSLDQVRTAIKNSSVYFVFTTI
jgi:dynamin 1-like protein